MEKVLKGHRFAAFNISKAKVLRDFSCQASALELTMQFFKNSLAYLKLSVNILESQMLS